MQNAHTAQVVGDKAFPPDFPLLVLTTVFPNK